MEPFLGQIIMFAGNFAPRGWALCDGQLLPISQNTALFSILGTTYGGDGRTNFKLPDLRGRVAVHEGSGPGLPPVSLGQTGGVANTALTVSNLPSHTHTASASHNIHVVLGGEADSDDGEANFLAGQQEQNVYSSTQTQDAMNAAAIGGGVNVQLNNTGFSTPFTNMQPFQVVNYIIALVGLFPSRS